MAVWVRAGPRLRPLGARSRRNRSVAAVNTTAAITARTPNAYHIECDRVRRAA